MHFRCTRSIPRPCQTPSNQSEVAGHEHSSNQNTLLTLRLYPREAVKFNDSVQPLVMPFEPYYIDDRCTIFNADGRKVLPWLELFDLLLSDPPYGMNLNTDSRRYSGGADAGRRGGNSGGTGKKQPIEGDGKESDPHFLLDASRDKIIWGWNHFPNRLPKGKCLVWLKRNDEAFGSFLSDAEIAWKSSGCGVFCHADLSNNAKAKERVHPTQKPLGLMQWWHGLYPKAKTVLDPFIGSGTTLVAAKLEGRHAVRIEINERYCELAADRLRKGVLFLRHNDGRQRARPLWFLFVITP